MCPASVSRSFLSPYVPKSLSPCLSKFADYLPLPAHTHSMIRFYPETVHIGTVPSLPVFLTTNHYPLTTAFPHNGLMIDAQTATAPPPPPVSRPAFFLTTNHYARTTAFQAQPHSRIETGTRGTRKQACEGASKAGVSARRAEIRELKPEDCFPFFRSLSPEFHTEQTRNPAPIGVECGSILFDH